MINWVNVSGGKDSTAMLLWTLDNEIPNCRYVFADTKWEHPATYEYLDYLQEKTGVEIERVESVGFRELSIQRKMIPSRARRFCTEELKHFPLSRHMREAEGDVLHQIFVGVRREESANRAKLDETQFVEVKYQAHGHQKGDSLLKSRQLLHHPILEWSHDDVFAMHRKHGIDPNPLYQMGMRRVGCFPCIMANFQEMGVIIKRFPEVVDRVAELEKEVGEASGKGMASLVAADKLPDYVPLGFRHVAAYLDKGPEITGLEQDIEGCMSVYGLCE